MIDIDLSEWSLAGPATHPSLRGLRFTDAQSRATANRLQQQRILEVVREEEGLAFRSFAHVGRVELGPVRVTIRPKLASKQLLELVRYAYSLRNFRLFDEAAFPTGDSGLLDLIIAQLRAEAQEILQRGVARRYVRRGEHLGSPRGRIQLAELARVRNPALTTLPCVHHPRSTDFLLNQVVLSGLELARGLAGAPQLRRDLWRTAQHYAELVSPLPLSDQALRAADRALNRQVSVYEPTLRLIRALYDGSHLDLEDGTTIKLKGFMFDMNRFFQALLQRFLRESLPECEVEDELPLRGMMAYLPGANPKNLRDPLPRPDFGVRTHRGAWQLLDAKYRDLWRLDLPREMLYQLAVYALSQPRGATAAILYPTEDRSARESIVEIREPASAAPRAFVAIRPVVIGELLELVRGGALRTREREQAARRLAFGGLA
jgi:5-methylcytosine-specific restriction enzyme subunit McrC